MNDFAEAIDNSYGMNSVMSIRTIKPEESNEEKQFGGLIRELQRMGRLGRIKQAALITRDGILIKGIPDNANTCVFAAMIAATLGAAESAFAEIQMGRPDMMVLCMNGEKILVMGADNKMLLTVIIEDTVNDSIALSIIEKTAKSTQLMS